MATQCNDLSIATAAEWSLHGSVACIFPKTRASGYEPAVRAARNAQRYKEDNLLHVAAFGTTREQISFAIVVINQLRSTKGLQVYGGGKCVQDKWRIEDLLECVITGSSCTDPKAHCTVIVDEDRLLSHEPHLASLQVYIGEAESAAPDRFGLWRVGTREFPCRYLFEHGFRFQQGHPSSEADQIQAAAVRAGCDWCPHLRIGERPALK